MCLQAVHCTTVQVHDNLRGKDRHRLGANTEPVGTVHDTRTDRQTKPIDKVTK